jgi:predicted SAM-dependent methyltransferase
MILDMLDGADRRVNLETDPLPFPDTVVDNIYTSHCLEHLEPCRLRFVFSDFFRVLKKGGKIRIVVPSFKKGVFYYFLAPWMLRQPLMPRLNSNVPDTNMTRLSSWFYTETNKMNGVPGHKTAWDFNTLRAFLREAGFKVVQKKNRKKCSEVFKHKDNPGYSSFSLYVEAVK